MEITILSKEDKPLLKRSEITARIFFDAAVPSRQEIANALVEKTKGKRDLVIIASIQPAFGETSATVTARQYEEAEAMKKLERANLIEKNKKVALKPKEQTVEADETETPEEPQASSDESETTPNTEE